MLAACVCFEESAWRTVQESESRASLAYSARAGRRRVRRCRSLVFVLLCGLFGFLTGTGHAAGQLAASGQNDPVVPSSAARAGNRAGHSATSTTRGRQLIEAIRLNDKDVPFADGVTIGPEAGNLEIQFAASVSASEDHLRYRLLGFDREWKALGRERSVLYSRLAPGHYEFDYQRAESGGARGLAVETIPITVAAPYWQTPRFRGLCILLLLLLSFALHRLRVTHLKRRNQQLQETVSLTHAELTLTAKVADDAQVALKEQALKDSLTGLWNRRAILSLLEKEIFRAQRDRLPIALVMIDLDHFKNINDTHGHLTGDEVLRETAARLIEGMRPYDFAGRYGGEEFLVVLPSCSPQNGVQRAEQFRRLLAEKPIQTACGPLAVTGSVGVAAYDDSMPLEDLIHQADQALYRAKRLGRNRVCAASDGVFAESRGA